MKNERSIKQIKIEVIAIDEDDNLYRKTFIGRNQEEVENAIEANDDFINELMDYE